MENITNQKPDNYLVWAILTTVMCCMPLGIVSIIKATSVDSLWASGDQAGAIKAAQEAKKWAIIGVIVSAVVWFLYIFIYLGIVVGAVLMEEL